MLRLSLPEIVYSKFAEAVTRDAVKVRTQLNTPSLSTPRVCHNFTRTCNPPKAAKLENLITCHGCQLQVEMATDTGGRSCTHTISPVKTSTRTFAQGFSWTVPPVVRSHASSVVRKAMYPYAVKKMRRKVRVRICSSNTELHPNTCHNLTRILHNFTKKPCHDVTQTSHNWTQNCKKKNLVDL